MVEKLVFTIYERAIVPMIIVTMKLLANFDSKIKDGLKMRGAVNGISPWLDLPAGTRPVWIHCASGEFEYAKPVIKKLKAQQPELHVLVTYFSPSIKKAVENFNGIDMSCPLPWDRPEDWESFFDHHQPRALLIARTDTWPEMLRQARKHNVPSLLFSATLVEQSGRARPLSKFFSRLIFSNLDAIYCVTSDDQRLFAELGCAEKTTVVGDTRYDQVIERLQNPKDISTHLSPSSSMKTFVAGSTWPEDEAQLLPALAKLRGSVRSILVPHEPHLDHIKDLEQLCSELGLSNERYSKLQNSWSTDVLVVDQIGILAELYQLGDIGFVGGSFKKTVHSVMEPLAAGCFTLVGPLHTNNREAIAFQKLMTPSGLPSVIVGNDSSDIERKLRLIVELSSDVLSASKKFIQQEIVGRSQKSDFVIAWLQDHLR